MLVIALIVGVLVGVALGRYPVSRQLRAERELHGWTQVALDATRSAADKLAKRVWYYQVSSIFERSQHGNT